ncbi:MAG: hypothetical protein EU548_02175 [Promethearchaeota archaeon]|nr:MAG: hypothetical protein EU548_02175 [Candidatus Lokiarchaeota archaeon]
MGVKALLINKDTLCIFSKIVGSDICHEPHLISGFLSAISLLAQDISRDKVKSVTMGKSKIYYHLIDEITNVDMILIVDSDIKDNEIMKDIEYLISSFKEMFDSDEIRKHMNESDYFTGFNSVVNQMIAKINGIVLDDKIKEDQIFKDFQKPDLIMENISLPFLFKMLKSDDVAKLVNSLVIGKRIAITGDPAMTKLMIDSLEIFSPHRSLEKVYWTDNFTDTLGDIVGVDPRLTDLLIDSTIVNLGKNKVIGINNNKYFEDLVRDIEKLETKKALPIIVKRINYLLNRLKELVNLINYKKTPTKKIDEFSKSIDTDQLEIMETYLKLNYPKSTERIDKTCNKIKRRVGRVVKGFQKRKW